MSRHVITILGAWLMVGCQPATTTDETSQGDDVGKADTPKPDLGKVYPGEIWANSDWFSTLSRAVEGYTAVTFELDKFGAHHAVSADISPDGRFAIYLPAREFVVLANGDRVSARFTADGLQASGCDFTFHYDGGAVYTLAEMGCVIRPIPELPLGNVFPDQIWANSVWFSTLDHAVENYTTATFEMDKFGTHYAISADVDPDGRFAIYLPAQQFQAPANGDRVSARFSGDGLRSSGCDFTFHYDGGAVYTLAEMGCVVSPRGN
jgi:hypothetical protein